MDLRRLRTGEWITGASGLLLFVALFLPWYELGQGIVAGPPDVLDAHASAWDAFTILDVLLALGALAAIAVVVVTALEPVPACRSPCRRSSCCSRSSSFSSIFRLADPPDVTFLESTNAPGARSEVEDLDRAAGAWLALVGVFGICAGGAPRHARRAPLARGPLHGPERPPVDAPREIETHPAPRVEAGP